MPEDSAGETGGGSGGSGDGSNEGAEKIESKMDKPADLPTETVEGLRDAAAYADFILDRVGNTGDTLVTMVDATIKMVGSILGNHMIARDLAITWGTDTTIRDITHDLTSSKSEMDAYWVDSGAKSSFNGYFDSATTALETAKDKFKEMSTILVEAIRYIYKIYGTAVDFVIDAASAAILLVPPTTMDAISTMMDKVGDLIKDGSEAVGDFSADATSLQMLPEQFTKPDDLPNSLDDSDLWDVEPVD